MPVIGHISKWTIHWEPWNGSVYVDSEFAGTAYTEDKAMEVAEDWIQGIGWTTGPADDDEDDRYKG